MAWSIVVAAFLCGVSSFANAGDEDGVAGYRFKIYDPDGDGIDGNEGGTLANGDGGSLSTTHLHEEEVVTPLLRFYFVRNLFVWWLR